MASRRGRPTEARQSGMASGRQWQASGRWAANSKQMVNSSADPCEVMCASICRRSDGVARRREDGKRVDTGQQMMGLDGK